MAADWKKIKAEYIRGGTSYSKLATKYSVSLGTLKHIAAREKWADLKNQTVSKLNTKLIESAISKETKKVDKIQDLADELLSFVTNNYTDLIKDSKDIRALTGALKDLREIKGCKSELDMQEQIARIEKLRKEVNSEEKTDNTIRVVIEGELNEYA